MMSQELKPNFHLKYASAVGLLLYSSYIIYSALQWSIYSTAGPGPGLFPLVLGGALLILSVVWLFKFCAGDADMQQKLGKASYLRIGIVIVLYLFAIFCMETLGFALTSFIIVAVSMYVLGKHHFLLIGGIALTTSLLCVLIFQKALGVPLPSMNIAWLG
ncbi:tripartite tricarboxylate transporter TctB family protein [Paenalcaligenes niemegkensis]|uniref:tripartite tricarboxylate transporter TctB family protein n=1 Tax=Paenalcaligenes niemegkensis TaxID=2895469 RepID=UPI001EE95B4A|nr:tripartite tricarboxylate transporter TctB family protein [Paenalcaligenes niemegkensis]MCQ9617683.1 tripartite tricarboxylate transporter TctB family protein [Paenalcaligenes niemegkensis]